jgi:hypothetical protein
MAKPIIIGIKNPHSSDPADALAPWPKNSSGYRLYSMLRDRAGVTEKQYLSRFDRWNLSDMDPGAPNTFIHHHIRTGATVLLLGDEVLRYFQPAIGIERVLIHPQVSRHVQWRQIPHPSGLCRFYNDPLAREVVGMLLQDMYEGRA